MLISKKIFVVIILLANLIGLKAQQSQALQPLISVNGRYMPVSTLSSNAGTIEQYCGNMQLRVPVFSTQSKSDSSSQTTFFQLATQANVSVASLSISSILNQAELFGTSAGITASLVKGRKNRFTVSLNAINRGDKQTFSSFALRYAGVVDYKRVVSAGFSFHAGLAYSYLFGRGLALPVLGISTKLGKRSRLLINFPNRISYLQAFGTRFLLSASLKPQGGYYYVSNQLMNKEYPESFYLRLRETSLSISANYKIKHGFSINTELGYLVRRSIRVASGMSKEAYLYENLSASNNLVFGLGIKYRFIKKKKEDATELLNDPDFEYLIDE